MSATQSKGDTTDKLENVRGEKDIAVVFVHVRKCQRKWSRAADHLTSLVVLRAVAGAEIFISRFVPWNDAAKVSTDSVDAVITEDLSVIDDKVGGVTLKTLHKLPVADIMRTKPATNGDRITLFGQGWYACASAAASTRDKEEDVGYTEASDDRSDAAKEEDEIHDVPAFHIGHKGTLFDEGHLDGLFKNALLRSTELGYGRGWGHKGGDRGAEAGDEEEDSSHCHTKARDRRECDVQAYAHSLEERADVALCFRHNVCAIR